MPPSITMVVAILVTLPQERRTAAGVADLFAKARIPALCGGCGDESCMGFPLEYTMPGCCMAFACQGPDDFPLVNTPCTCGDPTHWFVRYCEEAANAS